MEKNKVTMRFAISTWNGIPTIKAIPTDANASGMVVELTGDSIKENVRNVLGYVYEQRETFSEGYIAVRRGRLWGYVSIDLSEVVEPIYDNVLDVKEGFSVVCKGEKYGFLKMRGYTHPAKWTELEYDQAYSFCNGMGRVRKAGLYGYVGDTPDRKNWIPCEYEEAFDFDTVHPYAVVKVQGKYGVIDKGGNYKVEPVFDTYHRTHQRIGQEYYNATIGDKYYLLSANGTYKEVK